MDPFTLVIFWIPMMAGAGVILLLSAAAFVLYVVVPCLFLEFLGRLLFWTMGMLWKGITTLRPTIGDELMASWRWLDRRSAKLWVQHPGPMEFVKGCSVFIGILLLFRILCNP